MISDLCSKHQVVIQSAPDPEQAFRRLLRNAMNQDVKLRAAVQSSETAAFEPLCCRVGDAAVTDAKLDRAPDADPALDPKLIPVADKLKKSTEEEAEEK